MCLFWRVVLFDERKKIELSGEEDGEILGGIGRGENIIKIYCLNIFNKNA